jgi:hypothetical protein
MRALRSHPIAIPRLRPTQKPWLTTQDPFQYGLDCGNDEVLTCIQADTFLTRYSVLRAGQWQNSRRESRWFKGHVERGAKDDIMGPQ